MGKMQQRKGAAGERELAAILNEYGYQCHAGGSQTYGAVPDISGLPGVHVECKRVEKLNLLDAVEQATRDAAKFKDGRPAVFHRKNRGIWLVTMPLSQWIELYKESRWLSEY